MIHEESYDAFTRGAEYEVFKADDAGELILIDDTDYAVFFNRSIAEDFVIKEPDATELQDKLQQIKADNAVLVKVIRESLTAFEVALEEAQGEDWPEISKLRGRCKQALESRPGAAMLKELEGLRKIKALLIEKKYICEKWQGAEENRFAPSEEFVTAVYKIKDLDRQIDQSLAEAEKEE